MVDESLENLVRRIVRLRMKRGQRDAVAKAAGHPDGSWVSNWLSGAQRHVSVDEMAAMLKALGVSLAKVLTIPDATADLDWEVFGLMARVADKQLARDLVAGVADGSMTVVAKAQSASPARRRRAGDRGARRRAG